MTKLDLQAPVNTLFASSNLSGNLEWGYGTTDTAYISDYKGYYWNWWEPYREYHHHEYQINTKAENFEIAFKLARKLMEKKLVKPQKTIEDFFKLMDAIVEAL